MAGRPTQDHHERTRDRGRCCHGHVAVVGGNRDHIDDGGVDHGRPAKDNGCDARLDQARPERRREARAGPQPQNRPRHRELRRVQRIEPSRDVDRYDRNRKPGHERPPQPRQKECAGEQTRRSRELCEEEVVDHLVAGDEFELAQAHRKKREQKDRGHGLGGSAPPHQFGNCKIDHRKRQGDDDKHSMQRRAGQLAQHRCQSVRCRRVVSDEGKEWTPQGPMPLLGKLRCDAEVDAFVAAAAEVIAAKHPVACNDGCYRQGISGRRAGGGRFRIRAGDRQAVRCRCIARRPAGGQRHLPLQPGGPCLPQRSVTVQILSPQQGTGEAS